MRSVLSPTVTLTQATVEPGHRQGFMSPRPVTLILCRPGLYPVPVFTDVLIEDVAGIDDVKLPSDTTHTTTIII